MNKQAIKQRPWWRKKRWQILYVSVVGLLLFALSQFTLYHMTGGLHAADEYTDPSVSTVVYFGGRRLSEAAVSAREVGSIDSRGKVAYHQEPFMHWTEKWAYWNAIRKFPTLESCLRPEGRSTMDLSKFDWASMRTNTQVQVCLVLLAAQLESPQSIASWAEGHGFYSKYNIGSKCYRPKTGEADCSRVNAKWKKTGKFLDTPYPFFSTQTLLQQYHPIAVVVGASGRPEWDISMDKKQQAYRIRVRNEPNDLLP